MFLVDTSSNFMVRVTRWWCGFVVGARLSSASNVPAQVFAGQYHATIDKDEMSMVHTAESLAALLFVICAISY